MIAQAFPYDAGGLKMIGQIVRPQQPSSNALAILVFPDAFGLGEHAIHQATRLASLGHVVLACDLHGQATRLGSLEDVLAFVRQVHDDPSDIRARASGAMEALMKATQIPTSRIVSVGYCLGGTMGLELARSGAPIGGTIGLHCGLATSRPGDAHNISGKLLMCIGADDPVVPAEKRTAFEKEMRDAGVDWQLHVYGGVVHSFTDPAIDGLGQPQVTKYDAEADRRSWSAISSLLDEIAR